MDCACGINAQGTFNTGIAMVRGRAGHCPHLTPGWPEGPGTGHRDTQGHSSIQPGIRRHRQEQDSCFECLLVGQGTFLCCPAPGSHFFSPFNLQLPSTSAQLQPHLAALCITAHPIPAVFAILPGSTSSPGTPNPLLQGFYESSCIPTPPLLLQLQQAVLCETPSPGLYLFPSPS